MPTEQLLPSGGEAVVEDLISHHGNEREALRSVVAEYVRLQRRYELAKAAISLGYTRGWFARSEQ